MSQTHAIVQKFVRDLSESITNDVSNSVAAALTPPTFADEDPIEAPGNLRLISRYPKKEYKWEVVAPKKTPAPKTARKKGPIQLCPVPRCKNRAAPVFGMVCSDHKGIAKATIKKYREARKAKK